MRWGVGETSASNRGHRGPAVVRAEVGVLRLSVRGEALDRRGGQARGGGLLPHVLGGFGEAGRAVHPMEARELAHGFECRHAVDLGVDRRGDGVGPEGNRALLGARVVAAAATPIATKT